MLPTLFPRTVANLVANPAVSFVANRVVNPAVSYVANFLADFLAHSFANRIANYFANILANNFANLFARLADRIFANCFANVVAKFAAGNVTTHVFGFTQGHTRAAAHKPAGLWTAAAKLPLWSAVTPFRSLRISRSAIQRDYNSTGIGSTSGGSAFVGRPTATRAQVPSDGSSVPGFSGECQQSLIMSPEFPSAETTAIPAYVP